MKIEKSGKVLEYIIIPKPIKNAYFRVKDHQIVVTKGPRIPLQVIEKRLLDNFDQFHQLTQKAKPNYDTLMLFGQNFPLVIQVGQIFSYNIGEVVTITLKDPKDIDRAIQTLYGYELKKLLDNLTPWLIEALKPFRLSPLPTKIKYLKSKFGSCHTRKKEITMNAYLAKIDVIFTKYVLLHEYAHLLVPNHQKPFYDVLDLMMPGHLAIQKALRKHHI
jgi:predicted metal-dependent hydrolase